MYLVMKNGNLHHIYRQEMQKELMRNNSITSISQYNNSLSFFWHHSPTALITKRNCHCFQRGMQLFSWAFAIVLREFAIVLRGFAKVFRGIAIILKWISHCFLGDCFNKICHFYWGIWHCFKGIRHCFLGDLPLLLRGFAIVL